MPRQIENPPFLSRPSKSDTAIALPIAEPTMQELGGTSFPAFNQMIVAQAIATYPMAGSPTGDDMPFDAMLAGLLAMAPKDAQEGMMSAQMLGLHNAAMECLRRSALDDQTFEGRQANLTLAAKLSRTYALLMDTLGRRRTGGTQKIIVERVTVNAGGQAIVGTIAQTREGATEKPEEQPHAKQIAYAPVYTLPGLDAPGDALPIASHAERPLSHARGTRTGRPKG